MQNQFADMMKQFSQFKMPQFDAKAFSMPNFDAQGFANLGRRNLEAFSAANQAVSEGLQAVGRRQAELARSSVEKLLKTTKDMLVNGSPEINTKKQAELAKTMVEQSMSNLREVSELVAKSSFEAFDVLNKRAAESFEEISKLNKAA